RAVEGSGPVLRGRNPGQSPAPHSRTRGATTEFDKTPFTDDGMTEATSRRVSAETFDDAWRRVVAETPYRSETERAMALSAKDVIKPPGADRPGFHIAEKLRVVAIQGGRWFRGVTRVEPHPGGSLVTYTVVNSLKAGRWFQR